MENSKMEREEILEAQIEKAEYDGWEISERKKHTVLLEKQSFGSLKAHIIVAVLTIWWSFGIGNLLYALYKYLKPEKMILDMNDLSEKSDTENSDIEEAEGVDIEAEIAVKSPEERKQDLEERKLRLEEQKEKRRQQQEAAKNSREAMRTVRKFF